MFNVKPRRIGEELVYRFKCIHKNKQYGQTHYYGYRYKIGVKFQLPYRKLLRVYAVSLNTVTFALCPFHRIPVLSSYSSLLPKSFCAPFDISFMPKIIIIDTAAA